MKQFEQMGSKRKGWHEFESGVNWLFKYARPNTGEDWSEKLACEIAALLSLPHAEVELAECDGERGILSEDFTEGGAKGGLFHGNELLGLEDPGYPQSKSYHVSQHSINNIVRVLSYKHIGVPTVPQLPCGIDTPIDLFLGYLLLDVLIGNTDRHHENWGVLVAVKVVVPEIVSTYTELAPTYDHASCLGRELGESKIKQLLKQKDPALGIGRYARKARSG